MLKADDKEESARAVSLAACLTLVVCVAGLLAMPVVDKLGLWMTSLFYEQYSQIEPPAIALVTLFAAAVFMAVRRNPHEVDESGVPWTAMMRWTPKVLPIAVLVIGVIGTYVVFHHYAFVDDEYAQWAQAVIYSKGHASAVVGAPWCSWIAALQPTGIAVTAPCTWQLEYFPIHAMIRGAFMAAHLDAWAEPMLAAASTWLLFDFCRRAYPGDPRRVVVATTLFAVSTQFLVMAMTGYAMTAHLFFSTLFLWFYIRRELWAMTLMPWVGAVALGVHSPYPHLFFVAPLILRLLVQRRYWLFTYTSAVYALSVAAWIGHLIGGAHVGSVALATPVALGRQAGAFFTLVRGDGITTGMTITLLATWSAPLTFLFALVGVLRWKRLDELARWLLMSLLCTIALRSVFFSTQGAGWGPRYYFAVLANFAIIAAAGVDSMVHALGEAKLHRLILASVAAALIIQLPLRGFQAQAIVRPYVEASRYLESIDADVVVVYFEDIRWGRQLLRNDPFLRNRPKLLGFSELKQVGLDSVKKVFPGEVRFVSTPELQRFIPRSGRIGRFRLE